jgi:hypothetical protein
MPSAYTASGRFVLQATGENNNTWGVILNQGAFQLIDTAIFGAVSFALSGTHALTTANGAADEARNAVINITGGTGGSVTIPAVSKPYTVRNASSGQVTVGVAAGPMATFMPGEVGQCYCDGATTYRVRATDFGGTTLTGLGVPINPTDACTRAYADNLAFNAISLPGQPGNAGRFLSTDGTNPSWNFVGTAGLVDSAVTTVKLNDQAVTPSKIQLGAVGPAQIANGAVGTPQLAAGAVNSLKYADSVLQLTAPAGTGKVVQYFTGATPPTAAMERWQVGLNAAAETGANAGSDFTIDRFSDAGGLLGSPFSIVRSTGNVSIAQSLNVGGTIYGTTTVGVTGLFSSGGAANAFKGMQIYSGGNLQWNIVATNATGSGNVGGDFQITASDDNGVYLHTPLQITRSTGLVTIGNNMSVAGLVSVTGPNASAKGMQLQTNNSPRWNVIAVQFSETGGNVGSDFFIQRFDDSGAYLGAPLTITRSNGIANFAQPLTAANPTAIAGNQVMTGFYQNATWYNAQMMGLNVNGTTVLLAYANGSNLQWSVVPSDRQLKDNIKEPSLDPLDVVRNLPIRSCDYVPKPHPTDPENWPAPREHWPFSFMADEVDAVLPHATIKGVGDDEGRPVALHPQHLVAILWAAVQQLTERLEKLEAA